MKDKNFEELYQELLEEDNEEIKNIWEKAKEERKRGNIISLILCLIFDVAIIILMLKKGQSFNKFSIMPILMPIIFVDIFTYVITNMFFNKNQRAYNKIFKEKIIKKLINNFYDDLEYFPERKMPNHIYDEAGYNEYYNKYYSDDYFEAKLDGKYFINMAEVLTQKEETHTDSKGNTETTTYTIFHGLFFKLINEKSINSELKITRNTFGNKKIEMDSEEFEKEFDVSTTNQIIAMQLLTADIMEDLINFKKETNCNFDIIARNNNIYIRFHCGSMFEIKSLKKGAIDKTTVKQYFDILKFTKEISKKLIKTIEETEI